ncbi:hypothetical protein DFH27DRAFT_614341 [Peziza echinospora]|nr:hypothetical protein DFH27DRAFT_614341 [Peziza echinospora]
MVQIKIAVCGALLAGLSFVGAIAPRALNAGSDIELQSYDAQIEKREFLAPRGVDPEKLERMRAKLGPQQPKKKEPEPEPEPQREQPKPKPKGIPAKDSVNKTSRSPEPKRVKNSTRTPPVPARGPDENDSQKPRQKARPGNKPSRPSPSEGRPSEGREPDSEEGANQSNPSRSKQNGPSNQRNGGDGSSAPTTKNTQPKNMQTKDGPSRFQNKKARKQAQNPEAKGTFEELQETIPAPKKNPQTAPNVTQGKPKGKNDGSRARKNQRKPPSGDEDLEGPERTARDAVETAGNPNVNGPSGGRKSQNKPTSNRQATAKRPPVQSGADASVDSGEDSSEGTDTPEPSDDNNYFKWFRSNEQRPTDYVAKNKEGWKGKFAIPLEEFNEEAPAPPPTGLEKLPMNQRQREQEAQAAADKEANKKANRRAGF